MHIQKIYKNHKIYKMLYRENKKERPYRLEFGVGGTGLRGLSQVRPGL
jgi:hypothetical protein